MLKKIFHHHFSHENECTKFCCTRIENFSVIAGKLEIFSNVNIHVHCGQLTALIGPNGAGKSTLLKAILGEIKHTGNLHYVDAKGKHTGAPIIGYVPQYLNFDVTAPISVMDIFMASLSAKPVCFFSAKSFYERVLSDLTLVKAEHLIDRRLGTLSGGELQRVLLALALDPIPDLLLLDEPVSGIDHNGLELFYDIVASLREKADIAIILISHDFDLVSKYADQVILLNRKVLVSGTPTEVFSHEKTKKVFGILSGNK